MSASRYKSALWWKYQEYKNRLATELRLHLLGNVKGGNITVIDKWDKKVYPITTLVKITAKFYRETRRASDIDNLLKSTFDILQTAGLLYNDDQIREVYATLEKPVEKGWFELEIELIK